MEALQESGVDFNTVTSRLEAEGITAFVASYDELIAGVEQKRVGLSA